MLYLDDRIDILSPRELRKAYDALPQWRREAVDCYRHELSRRGAVMVYELLRRGLNALYGLEFVPAISTGEYGKPYLVDYPHIKFSLSHSGTVAGCVIDSVEVGLDVQMVRPYKESLGMHVLNRDELERVLEAPDRDVAFAIEWTRKESYGKLTGRGIGLRPANLLNGVMEHCDFTTQVDSAGRYVATLCRYKP